MGLAAAWLAVGVAMLAGLAPLGCWSCDAARKRSAWADGDGESRNPGSGEPEAGPGRNLELPGYTLARALRTPAFWVFAIGAALYGLVASGIGLFNESILAERGFGPDVYYQTLVVTAMTGLAGNFLGGWLARMCRWID